MTEHSDDARRVVIDALVARYSPNRTEYDPADLADLACSTTFRAADGYLSIASLTFGDVADVAVAALSQRYPMGPSRLGVLGKAVHHIDGDPTNNDPGNLRIVDLEEHATSGSAEELDRRVQVTVLPDVGAALAAADPQIQANRRAYDANRREEQQ